MPIMISDTTPESNPAPAGLHQAVCAFVEDIGDEDFKNDGKWKRKVVICWELGELMDDGRPWMISQRYTASLNEKATLRHHLESWRGRPFTENELEAFDLETIRGVGCQLQIIHKVKESGGKKATILAIVPLPKGVAALPIHNIDPPKWIADSRDKNKAAMTERDAARMEAAAVAGGNAGDASEVDIPF